MITKDEREKLKKVLSGSYSKDVQNLLRRRKVFNSNQEEYSTSHIANVMNGRVENLGIEKAIFEAYALKKKKQDALNKRKEILEE